jgi:hypothetical protein
MNQRKAKLIRRTAKENLPGDWPESTQYTQTNSQMRQWVNSFDKTDFKNYMTYTLVLKPCLRSLVQAAKKKDKNKGKYKK